MSVKTVCLKYIKESVMLGKIKKEQKKVVKVGGDSKHVPWKIITWPASLTQKTVEEVDKEECNE